MMMTGSRSEWEIERRWKGSRGGPWFLRSVVRTAGAAVLGFALMGSPHGASAVTKPAETADQVLVSENESWNRYLHDALRLPAWLDLGIEQRTRFEFLEDPWRPRA